MRRVAFVDPRRDQIGSSVRRGLAWKLFSQTTMQSSTLVVTVVLARLLTPHDFGIAGMVLVLSSFVIPFADLGMGSALVQRASIDERDRSTIFWTSVAAGALFTGLGIVASHWVSRFYGHATVGPLFMVLSLSFIITAVGSTHRSLLLRSMDFRGLELRFMAGVLAGSVVGIGLAAAGFGPWALVGQQLAVTSVSTVLLWVLNPWRPRFLFARRSLVSLGSFGARNLVSEFFFRANQNADNLLIGRFLGAAPLGFYALAYNTMVTPLTRLVSPVQEVLYPAFSRLQDDRPGFSRAWLQATRVVCVLCFPVMFGLIVVAPDFVPTVFGAQWHRSVAVLQILAVVGALQCIQSQNSSVLRALDRTGTLLWFSAISFVLNVGAFAFGLQWGIIGVAASFTVSSLALSATFTGIAARALGVPPATVIRNMSGVIGAATAMAAVCFGARVLLVHASVATPLRLVSVTLLGALVFIPLAILLNRDLAQRLWSLRSTLRPSAAARAGRALPEVGIGLEP